MKLLLMLGGVGIGGGCTPYPSIRAIFQTGDMRTLFGIGRQNHSFFLGAALGTALLRILGAVQTFKPFKSGGPWPSHLPFASSRWRSCNLCSSAQ
jgi:hypothetical protein